MRRLALLMLFAASLAPAQNAVGIRILLGIDGKIGDKWDGSVSAEGANVTSVEPWRFDAGDEMGADHSWKASIHAIRLFAGANQQNAVQNPIANGVLVFLDSASAIRSGIMPLYCPS